MSLSPKWKIILKYVLGALLALVVLDHLASVRRLEEACDNIESQLSDIESKLDNIESEIDNIDSKIKW